MNVHPRYPDTSMEVQPLSEVRRPWQSGVFRRSRARQSINRRVGDGKEVSLSARTVAHDEAKRHAALGGKVAGARRISSGRQPPPPEARLGVPFRKRSSARFAVCFLPRCPRPHAGGQPAGPYPLARWRRSRGHPVRDSSRLQFEFAGMSVHIHVRRVRSEHPRWRLPRRSCVSDEAHVCACPACRRGLFRVPAKELQ